MIRTIGEPIEVKRAPETGYQAQFSAPYAVTAGLFGGGGLGLGLDDFTDALAQDPARRAVMARVDVVARRPLRGDLPAPVPGRRHAAHHLRRGRSSRRCSPTAAVRRRPLSDDELGRRSSADNVAGRLPDAAADGVRRAVLDLAHAGNVADVLAPLSALTNS